MIITRRQVAQLFPKASPDLVDALFANWPLVRTAGIITGRRMRFFLASVGVETGGLKAIEENFRYRADSLCRTWPKHFRHRGTPNDGRADAEDYAFDASKPYVPQAQRLATYIYGLRLAKTLGNSQPIAGWLYRGSGWQQTTGEYNFTKAQERVGAGLGLDLVNNPDDLRKPVTGLVVGLAEWHHRGCNDLADRNDVIGCRRAINGGTNGLDDFRAYLAHAARIIPDGDITGFEGTTEPMASTGPMGHEATLAAVQEALDKHAAQTAWTGLRDDAPMPDVHDGPALPSVVPDAQGDDAFSGIVDGVYDKRVETVQTMLWNRNYKMVGRRDGKMGRNTRAAIVAYRQDAGLPLTPAIDAQLVTSLTGAPPAEIAPERAMASTADVRKAVPSIAQAAKARLLALFTAGAAGVNQAVSYITTPGNLDTVKGTAQTAKGWASDLGLGVWAVSTVALAAGIGAVWWYSRKSEAAQAQGYRAGEIIGQ